MEDNLKLKSQLDVLREVQHDYNGRTIENIIKNIESILEFKESKN